MALLRLRGQVHDKASSGKNVGKSMLEQLTVRRNQVLMQGISKGMKGLEIGPSYNPVAPKSAGWNIFTLDHLPTEALRAKMQAMHINTQLIEEVDFVCADGDYLHAIPQSHHGSFDYIIASHVIEHIADPIRFLNAMQALLKPGGLLLLVVPDKRMCFDYFRPLTLTSDVLYAHHQGHTRHTKKTAFEQIAYASVLRGDLCWTTQNYDREHINFVHTLQEAQHRFDTHSENPDEAYQDFHVWKFIRESFELLLLELYALKKTAFFIKDSLYEGDIEFYAVLQLDEKEHVIPPNLQQRRLQLLNAMAASYQTLQEARAIPQVLPMQRKDSVMVSWVKSKLPPSVKFRLKMLLGRI